MLYCPRCNREYKEGSQRFCIHDGGRLTAQSAAGRKPAGGGVFTSLMEKTSAAGDADEILSLPNFVPAKPGGEKPPAPSFISDPGPAAADEKAGGRQLKINELPSFQAPLGDRKKNPTGRLALSWENPNVLLGHIIRGRYFIEQRAAIDDICITYLAQDRANQNKRVIFKVLAPGSDFIQNTTDERVGLSHLNHPHIVKILDSGEMPEGMPFAVFEYVEGESLRELLDSGDMISDQDTAKIVKQISEALSGAEQNGVLHYDVRPQKVILKTEADGARIAKVTDFALAKGYKGPTVRKLKDVAYQSPEQLQGRDITPASESYSLAAIAFEMMTGRLPFNFTSVRELFEAQKRGLQTKPHVILPKIPSAVDDIFTRALDFDPAKRYQKSRDFGEALYNAVNSSVFVEDELPIVLSDEDILALHDPEETVEDVYVPADSFRISPADDVLELSEVTEEVTVDRVPRRAAPAAVSNTAADTTADASAAGTPVLTPAPDGSWAKRSVEPEGMSVWAVATIALLAVILIGGGVYVFLNYFNNAPAPVAEQPAVDPNANQPANQPVPGKAIESNPPPRVIEPPPNSVFYQNSKESIPKSLLKNFRGFSLYYPKDWKKNESESNFLNISKPAEGSAFTEQMLVSWYESKGTFEADSVNFQNLAKKLNEKWDAGIPNFKPLSQGEVFINNGRKAYEVKFQGEAEKPGGEKVAIWGRTLFLPAGRLGVKNGMLITMLATSLSPEVKSADDVGLKGDLKQVLFTFEPDSLDPGI